jgi:hypothetical protein
MSSVLRAALTATLLARFTFAAAGRLTLEVCREPEPATLRRRFVDEVFVLGFVSFVGGFRGAGAD